MQKHHQKQKQEQKHGHENPILPDEDEKESRKREFKEYIDRDRQVELLKGWLEAIEGKRDLELDVQDEHCKIPAKAFTGGNTRIEYEYDDKKGEYELELTLKWR